MKCFYHASDLDGKCSGAIVKYAHGDAVELIPINYGNVFPWDSIKKNEEIYIVDFCLQPFSDMEKLNKICELTWIDHHKSSIEQAQSVGFKASEHQSLSIGLGACYLVWKSEVSLKVPYAVELLAHYDVWDLKWGMYGNALEFHSGIMLEDTDPENQNFWRLLFDEEHSASHISRITTNGRTVIKYQDNEYKEYLKNHAIHTSLDGIDTIAINRGMASSRMFDPVYSTTPLKVAFSRLPSNKWTVSLYSTVVDVSKIAMKYGGGGHKEAAGFQCTELPFDV